MSLSPLHRWSGSLTMESRADTRLVMISSLRANVEFQRSGPQLLAGTGPSQRFMVTYGEWWAQATFPAYLTPWRARALAGTQTGTAELHPHTCYIPTTWPAHSPPLPYSPSLLHFGPWPLKPCFAVPQMHSQPLLPGPACPLCCSGCSVSSGADCCPQCTPPPAPQKNAAASWPWAQLQG